MPHGHSCLVAPLRSRGGTFGLMTLDAMVCRQYPESVLHHVGVFASLLALGLKQAEHLARLAERERSLAEEVSYFREVQRRDVLQEPIRAESPAMRAILDQLSRVAATVATVLITGETGTGKELVARAIHAESDRADAPFVAINCAAIPEALLESELFGHAKGAFTGANFEKRGLFEEADGGTFFLDEIADMPIALQIKMLRVLQEGEIRRVGETRTRNVSVRIVAATNKNLAQEVAAGRFREDLYYRLNVVKIDLAPLRRRREDVPLLGRYFCDKVCARLGRASMQFADEVTQRFLEYDWPGNVRELENTIERAVVLSTGPVITARAVSVLGAAAPQSSGLPSLKLRQNIEWVEKETIRRALESSRGVKKDAAELMGISQRALSYYVAKYRVSAEK